LTASIAGDRSRGLTPQRQLAKDDGSGNPLGNDGNNVILDDGGQCS
jgi:hypothetical protein